MKPEMCIPQSIYLFWDPINYQYTTDAIQNTQVALRRALLVQQHLHIAQVAPYDVQSLFHSKRMYIAFHSVSFD